MGRKPDKKNLIDNFRLPPLTQDDLRGARLSGEIKGRGINQDLMEVIFMKYLKDGRLKKTGKMAKLMTEKMEVDNYQLAKIINPTIRNTRRTRVKLRKKDYFTNKDNYDKQIQNRIRAINRWWKPLMYKIEFRSNRTHLVNLYKIQY